MKWLNIYVIRKKIVKENGLKNKLGVITPYKKSRIIPPIIISYPGAIIINVSAKMTVIYHGDMNILKKNNVLIKKWRIIVA